MKKTIPLQPGRAHLQFQVDLSDKVVTIRLDWLTRYEHFIVKVSDQNRVYVSGAGLHPNMDILVDVFDIPGQLYLEGKVATIRNLGTDARLVYET